MLAVMKTDFENGNDMRVLQARCGGGFDAKTLYGFLARQRAEQKHLDCDNAVEADLMRFIDDAHAASGDFFEKFVVAKPGCAQADVITWRTRVCSRELSLQRVIEIIVKRGEGRSKKHAFGTEPVRRVDR